MNKFKPMSPDEIVRNIRKHIEVYPDQAGELVDGLRQVVAESAPDATGDDGYGWLDDELQQLQIETISYHEKDIYSTRRGKALADATKHQIISRIQCIADQQHKTGMKNGRFGYVPKREVKKAKREAMLEGARRYKESLQTEMFDQQDNSVTPEQMNNWYKAWAEQLSKKEVI